MSSARTLRCRVWASHLTRCWKCDKRRDLLLGSEPKRSEQRSLVVTYVRWVASSVPRNFFEELLAASSIVDCFLDRQNVALGACDSSERKPIRSAQETSLDNERR